VLTDTRSILAIMPLSALFILFDFVIHNPNHPDTQSNITLLNVVSGHFNFLEHVSHGALPGSHLSRFAQIAQEYIQKLTKSSSKILESTHHTKEPSRNVDHSSTDKNLSTSQEAKIALTVKLRSIVVLQTT
jgi:hypothetical protein